MTSDERRVAIDEYDQKAYTLLSYVMTMEPPVDVGAVHAMTANTYAMLALGLRLDAVIDRLPPPTAPS